MRSIVIIFIIYSVLDFCDSLCKTQHVTVIGQVGCGGRSVKNVEIELREHDTRIFL